MWVNNLESFWRSNRTQFNSTRKIRNSHLGLPLKVVKSSLTRRCQRNPLRSLIALSSLQRPSFHHGAQQLRIPHSQPPDLHNHIGELQLRPHCSRTTRSTRLVCNHEDIYDSSGRGDYINVRLRLPLRGVLKGRYRCLSKDKLQETDIGIRLHARDLRCASEQRQVSTRNHISRAKNQRLD